MIRLFSFLGGTLFFGWFLLPVRPGGEPFVSRQSSGDLTAYKLQNAIGCFAADEGFTDNNSSIPLLKGSGSHVMRVSTANDSAFLYFNQGIKMFYGFHFIEARASFKKAQAFDTSFALGYLGEALTYGPNINNAAYKLRPYVLELLEKTKRFSGAATDMEKALIEAQLFRYAADTSRGLQSVNEAYAGRMKVVAATFPDNADAGALYADALMQLHPWDLYDNTGKPKPWTAPIENEITRLVKRFPDHPGLNHYYIHCVEGSNTALRGLESARRLPRLAPGLSHMLHMSSHIYVRTGFYADGVSANRNAIEAYEQYKKIFPDVQRYVSLYYTHNLSMAFANALMLPDYGTAIRMAHQKRQPFLSVMVKPDTLTNAEQYSYALPYLAWVRYGRWDSILAEPDVPQHQVYIRMLQSFAKGMALAKKHRTDEAYLQLQAMESVMDHPVLQLHGQFENAPSVGGHVAMGILKGMIAHEMNKNKEAVSALEQAVQAEDAMMYNEPQDWLLPARQYLGSILLSNRQFSRAAAVFREDLRLHPKNAWSLAGLYKALAAQRKTKAAKAAGKEARKALAGSDMKWEELIL